MKILDLFCGEGIAARGLMKHGEVVGFDTDPRHEKHYPGIFQLGDWKDGLKYMTDIDFIWASPPCHQYSNITRPMRKAGKKYDDLVVQVIHQLQKTGKPFVVENVPQAPFKQTFMLCGQMFNLNLKRHRKFYANFFVLCPPHMKHTFGVQRVWGKGQHAGETKASWCKVMGVTDCKNVTKHGLALGVPVAYVDHIMKQWKMWK